MRVSVENQQGKAVVKLDGRFDFNTHRDFRGGYEGALAQADVREIVIDLGGVDYLDSSALGMLLMLRDKALAGNKQVALINCSGNVRQVLDIANFGKLFKIG